MTRDYLLPQPIVRLGYERFEHKDTHQDHAKPYSTEYDNGHRRSDLDISLEIVSSLNGIDCAFTARLLVVETELGDVLRSKSADSDGLGSARSPSDSQLPLSDPPDGDEQRRV